MGLLDNLSGSCLYSPSLHQQVAGKLFNYSQMGQINPMSTTWPQFYSEMVAHYNTGLTPTLQQATNYEISAFTECVSAYTSGSTGIVNYWSADTTALPADYIRVSGNTTSAKVGGNLEVSGVVRTNIISNGIATTNISILPDDSSKKITFGFSNEQGLGTVYSFLTLEMAYPTTTDTMFQLAQGGDLVFKSNLSHGHELFRLDQDLNQASAYTLTSANSLGVSGHTFLGTTPTNTDDNPRLLIVDGNYKVTVQTLSNLTAKTADLFWSADTTSLPSTYIRTSGNTTGVKIGGNLDVSGNTVVDGDITASGTSASPNSKIQLVADGGEQLVGLERVGTGGNAVKGQIKVRDNLAVDVYFTAEDNIAAYINNAGAALSIGATTISEANTNLYVTGGGIITGGLGVSGDTEVTGTLSADTMSGRTLTLKENLGVSGRTYLGTLDAAGAGYTADKILVAQSTGEVEYLTAAQVGGGGGFWSADTVAQPADYIRVSGNTTSAIVGGKLEVTGDTKIAGNFNVEKLFQNYSGDSNPSLFIGMLAGESYSEGGFGSNIALGYKAMQAEDSQSIRNVAVGALALLSLEDGDYNVAIGSEALQFSTGGTHNVAIGWKAQAGTTTLTHNTSVGAETMNDGGANFAINFSNRRDNTAMGYSAGYTMRYGRNNAAFGSQSLEGDPFGAGNTGPTGSTAMGYKALGGHCQGTYNIGLGFEAGDNITTGSYNISIGPNADTVSPTADYQMNIGDIIFGNDEYSESKIGNVGIGYPDPKTVLDVHHSGDDLTNMVTDTGGGEVVYFGTNDSGGDSPLAAGKLMYLHTDGAWYYVDANDPALGASQLLGIGLGTLVKHGILIRGFFNLDSEEGGDMQGTFASGAPCYVSAGVTGSVDFTAPSGSGDFVRVIGYGTATANIIYFTPDNTWVEIS